MKSEFPFRHPSQSSLLLFAQFLYMSTHTPPHTQFSQRAYKTSEPFLPLHYFEVFSISYIDLPPFLHFKVRILNLWIDVQKFN